MVKSKCKSCGSEVDKGIKVCPSCGSKLTISLWKKLLIGFGILLVMGLVFGGGEKSSNRGVSSSMAQSNSSVMLPQNQQEFINVIQEFKNQYKQASNELQKSALKKKREEKMRRIISGDIVNWIGELDSLTTTSEGNAHIAIKLYGSDNILLANWNNELSDIGTNSLIKNGSALYEKASRLSVGDRVKLRGTFVYSGGNISEQSMFEEGSMVDPEFTFRFKDVAKY